jgi:hypothetical protein
VYRHAPPSPAAARRDEARQLPARIEHARLHRGFTDGDNFGGLFDRFAVVVDEVDDLLCSGAALPSSADTPEAVVQEKNRGELVREQLGPSAGISARFLERARSSGRIADSAKNLPPRDDPVAANSSNTIAARWP